ncbi:MAG: chemotaxis protein CheB [Nitrospira sp.]|nr:chemotaxis protein CheB [Nitrospira sp.]
MAARRAPRNAMRADERLGRLDQKTERFVQPTELPLESLIVMGTSAGGYVALQDAVKGLSGNLPAAVIVLLHAGSRSMSGENPLVNLLGRCCEIPVQAARSGERLQPGKMYVTPPGHSAYLKERTLWLEPSTQAHPVTTINRLFKSAAREYHDRVIGVILTGLLRDGTEGLQAVHDAGGLTIVQDPSEAEYPDMPENAMRNLPVTFVLYLAEIGPALDLLARRGTVFESGLSASVRMLKERVSLFKRLITQSTRNVDTRDFLIAELAALQEDLHGTQNLLTEALAPREKKSK